ncbi:MAG: ATP-binding protein [Candidatus Acidiferrales bacterium]
MKLFLRIFLSFWLATILMIAAVLVAGEIWPGSFPGDHGRLFEPDLAASVLTKAANGYERQGAAAFLSLVTIRHSSLYLFDQDGNVLAKEGNEPTFSVQMARAALQSGHSEISRFDLSRFKYRMIFACPVQSATGRHYAAVMTVFEARNRLLRPRFWFNLMIAMLPAALVCMVLSLYLTRPITRLRATAQRLAGGDLSARSSPHRIVRRDELGDLARDFDAMAAQIQLLMTAQRRFVADVSHELGAPLTRMHLALALLRRQFHGKNSGELERIERETDKLSNLVQQLLLLAGLEAGACPAETLAPISTRSFCESIIEDANFEAAHTNSEVTGSRQDITLLVYPQLLRRAIDNVLRNAIRYAPEGSEIRLDCRADDDLHHVILEVLDCGPGVPDSMLSDIFQPFFRTAPGRESSSGGTGLGLSIASEAVRLHDGTIAAQNRKGGGLQVTITLPLRVPVCEEDLEPILGEP